MHTPLHRIHSLPEAWQFSDRLFIFRSDVLRALEHTCAWVTCLDPNWRRGTIGSVVSNHQRRVEQVVPCFNRHVSKLDELALAIHHKCGVKPTEVPLVAPVMPLIKTLESLSTDLVDWQNLIFSAFHLGHGFSQEFVTTLSGRVIRCRGLVQAAENELRHKLFPDLKP